MLVLSRKVGETVVIGDGVHVTVLEVRSDGSIRLGIDAPRDVPVHRSELIGEVASANEAAVRAAAHAPVGWVPDLARAGRTNASV